MLMLYVGVGMSKINVIYHRINCLTKNDQMLNGGNVYNYDGTNIQILIV